MSDKKPAITTNQVSPIVPERSAVLKPAKGPMITTANVDEIRKGNAAVADPVQAKKGRKSSKE